MSTTRSTPECDLPYTLVGRRSVAPDTTRPGLILLNRSSRLVRRDYIAAVAGEEFSDVISVELRDNSYTVESLSREFPRVRFLLLNEPVSIGARINMAMRIMNTDTVLVMWSTMDPPGSLARALEAMGRTAIVALTPALRNERGESLPVVQVPALQRRQLRVMTLPIRGRAVDTLFPFDYVGLYDRRRFAAAGMFDEQIWHPFWQKLDLGFRVALWGERIRVEPTFRMTYRSMPDPEDQTAAEGYERFYARNLAIRIREGGAEVPLLHALPFALRSRKSIPEALRVFRDASRWVGENRERFLHDARTVVKEWSVDHG